MNRPHFAPLLLCVAFAVGAAAAACKDSTKTESARGGEHAVPSNLAASPDRIPPGVNAVQNEMRLLHEVLRDSVTAIAMGSIESIPERLHSIDRARELTDKAIETGAYKLPKNADKLDEFHALDEAFHHELETLGATAKSKNQTATATQLGVVLGECGGCHDRFRPVL